MQLIKYGNPINLILVLYVLILIYPILDGLIGTLALNMMVLLLVKFTRSVINTVPFTLNKKIKSLIYLTLSLT